MVQTNQKLKCTLHTWQYMKMMLILSHKTQLQMCKKMSMTAYACELVLEMHKVF